MRWRDFAVNASHIIKLANKSRTTLANCRKLWSPADFEIVKGSREHQGTYVKIDVGMELCRKYALSEVQERLSNFRKDWIQDHPQAPLKGPGFDGPLQAGDAHGTDTDSDTTDSEDSVASRDPNSIQRRSQLIPSIRYKKGTASSRHSTFEIASSPSRRTSNYEVWDSQRQLSNLTEIKPDLKPCTSKTASKYGSLGSLGDLFSPI